MSSNNSPVLVVECANRAPLWLQRWRARLTGHQPLVRVVWQQDGTWLLIDAAGREQLARLLPDSWCSPWLMQLRWRLESGAHARISVWRWQMPTTTWQRWRQRLWLQGGAVADSRDSLDA